MNTVVIRNNCPGCGRKNDQNKEIFERDFTFAGDIVAFSHYNIYSCEKCRLVYAGDIVERSDLDDYYDKMSKYDSADFCLSPKLEEYYKYEVETLKPYLNNDFNILDIGCAFGGLLNEFKNSGFDNVYGLEPSKKNCEYAMAKYGIEVLPGMLGDSVFGGRRFDVLILNSVLEHIMDVRGCVRNCKKLMRNEGLLIITVPDVSMFKEEIDLFQQFSVEHINFFCIEALEQIMGNEGFENIAYKRDYDSYDNPAGNMITIWKYNSDFVGGGSLSPENSNGREDSHNNLKIYMDKCWEFSEVIRKRMEDNHLDNGYYIWGTGTLTAMLIQLGIIKIEQIKGVFDSNKNYHGLNAYGAMIEDPINLKTKENYPIIIASQHAFDAIKTSIEDMGIENRIIDLFENHE